MTRNTGIWIDGSKAVIIELQGDEAIIQEVPANVEYHQRIPGEGKDTTRFGNQFFDLEHKKEHRIQDQRKHFLDKVRTLTLHADQIVVFGPAGTKTELEKIFRLDHIMAGKLLAVHTAPDMTHNQMTAWVRKYFKNTHVEL